MVESAVPTNDPWRDTGHDHPDSSAAAEKGHLAVRIGAEMRERPLREGSACLWRRLDPAQ
jgi:hypothetical protein